MSAPNGDRTPEMRGRRERLTVHRPLIEMALASLNIDDANIVDARRFGNKLQAQVDRWQVGREVFSGDRRITKSEADAKLRLMMRQTIGVGR